jgi:uncharacterized protein YndB with AHSA1/START domain
MTRNEYVFIEEWFVPASIEDVWEVLADGKRLPLWWRGVYLEATPLDGADVPRVGARLRARARGFLPYHLRFTIEATALERPNLVAVRTIGDLTGTWQATLSEEAGGTRVRTEEHVTADKPILRLLTPLLKPLFEANHRWTTPRAASGMRTYLEEQGKLVDLDTLRAAPLSP